MLPLNVLFPGAPMMQCRNPSPFKLCAEVLPGHLFIGSSWVSWEEYHTARWTHNNSFNTLVQLFFRFIRCVMKMMSSQAVTLKFTLFHMHLFWQKGFLKDFSVQRNMFHYTTQKVNTFIASDMSRKASITVPDTNAHNDQRETAKSR